MGWVDGWNGMPFSHPSLLSYVAPQEDSKEVDVVNKQSNQDGLILILIFH